MIRAIFAVDSNGGMGKSNNLPWPHDKEDMLWFRKHTLNQIVVMGSATWLSDMVTPLPKRINVVISKQNKELFTGADLIIKPDLLKEGFQQCNNIWLEKNIWIIGGSKLLVSARSLINEAYITHFNNEYNCDTFIDLQNWLLNSSIQHEFKSENKTFKIYKMENT